MVRENNNIPTVSVFRFYANSRQILKNPLPFHINNFNKLGDTFQIKLGFGKPLIFSRDPQFAEYVLQRNHKNYKKSPIQTKDMAKYLGKGLLTSEGEHWRKQRKLIQPAFHKKQLEKLLETIKSAILFEIQKIKTEQPIDIFPIFNDLAFQTVVKSLFSSAINKSEINRLQHITEAAQKMLVRELRQPYLGWWFHWGGAIRKHQNLVTEARGILKKIVSDRRQRENREGDLLDMLLDARYEDGKAMEEEQLLDEILILFTAGHETTSNALTFTAELLARNPEVQEKIASEVMEAENTATDLMQVLKSCPYTQNVIEESMRLYPPAYFIDRKSVEDDYFEGKFVPKGSSVLFAIYEVHQHRKHWEKPETFIPQRFSENEKRPYFPFGAGPRKCIGNNFAMYEMILTIAEVIKQFKIDYKEESIKINPLITLKPKDAFLQFKKREL